MKKEKQLHQAIKKRVEENSSKLSEKEQEMMKEALSKVLGEGALPFEAMGFDKSFINYIYNNGYQLYQAGHFDKAKEVFLLLMQIDPSDPKFPMGVAGCYKQQKNYEEAVHYFFQTAVLDKENPKPFYLAAECFLQKNDLMSSLMTLKLSKERAEQEEKYQPLAKQIDALIKNLRKKIKKPKETGSSLEDLDPEVKEKLLTNILDGYLPIAKGGVNDDPAK